MTAPLSLTHSSSLALLSCPTFYSLHYNHKLRPLEWRSWLSVGRAFHRGCEVYDGQRNLGEAELAAARMLGEEMPSEHRDALRYTALLHVLLVGWAKHMGLPHGVTSREQVLERELAPGLTAMGMVDAVLYDDRVHDYKTTSSTVREAVEVQRHGIQIPTYQWLLGSTQPASIDVVKKPVLRPRKGEDWYAWRDRALAQQDADPLRFFARIEVPWSQASEAEMRTHYMQCADMVRHFAEHGWPRKWGQGCKTAWGAWCEYRPLCWWRDNSKFYTSSTAHDELGR